MKISKPKEKRPTVGFEKNGYEYLLMLNLKV